MKTYRRQRQQYFFAGVLGTIFAVNVLFYVILFRPARSDYKGLQESIKTERVDVASRTQRIDRLDKLSKQLETSAQDRAQLITRHFLPRTPGWSELLPLLEEGLQKTGVKNQHQDYTIDQAPQYGLYSVKIRLPVTGLYPNVVNLLKELEESQTFFIINSIDVQGNSETSTSRDVVMALNLETFFYQ